MKIGLEKISTTGHYIITHTHNVFVGYSISAYIQQVETIYQMTKKIYFTKHETTMIFCPFIHYVYFICLLNFLYLI